jgi:exonuclease III
MINNNDMYRCDRCDSKSGGILVYAKSYSNFKLSKIDFKQNNIYECVVLKIKPNNSRFFYISTIYCPPNKTCEFKLKFEEDFKIFLNKEIVFTGDYNIDINKPVTKNWINKCTDLGLK